MLNNFFINEVNIKCFAGVKDLHINFDRGLNIIYGDNRRGKTTLCAFIRYMFFGLGDNGEDFLPYYDDIFTEGLLEAIHENQYDRERADLICHDGMVGAAGGAIWFAQLEDGEIAVLTVQNPEGNSLYYDGPAGVQPG